MKITRRLGYQYIWIDSLCIIQHPSNTAYFHKEAVTMCDVYSNSSCNIAALGLGNDSGPPANSSSPVDYCYTNRNPLGYIPCRIVKSNENEAIYAGREQHRRLPNFCGNLLYSHELGYYKKDSYCPGFSISAPNSYTGSAAVTQSLKAVWSMANFQLSIVILLEPNF